MGKGIRARDRWPAITFWPFSGIGKTLMMVPFPKNTMDIVQAGRQFHSPVTMPPKAWDSQLARR
jgi:hypothetical protein